MLLYLGLALPQESSYGLKLERCKTQETTKPKQVQVLFLTGFLRESSHGLQEKIWGTFLNWGNFLKYKLYPK